MSENVSSGSHQTLWMRVDTTVHGEVEMSGEDYLVAHVLFHDNPASRATFRVRRSDGREILVPIGSLLLCRMEQRAARSSSGSLPPQLCAALLRPRLISESSRAAS